MKVMHENTELKKTPTNPSFKCIECLPHNVSLHFFNGHTSVIATVVLSWSKTGKEKVEKNPKKSKHCMFGDKSLFRRLSVFQWFEKVP